jgi:Family of unknown function (DUF6152)
MYTQRGRPGIELTSSVVAALILLFTLALALAVPAAAHHSTSNFDPDKTTQITGVVSYVSFTNPHSFFDMDVMTPDGVAKYKVFATSKVALLRYGWRPDSVKLGDTISINGRPDRSNPLLLYMLKIKFADGTEWSRDEIAQ